MISNYQEVQFTDEDVVDVHDCVFAGQYNPTNVRPWLLHDHGFALAVVFAECVQDALDIATDVGKMTRYLVSALDFEAMTDSEKDGLRYLGRDEEPHDIDTLVVVALPVPPFSFCVLFNALAK